MSSHDPKSDAKAPADPLADGATLVPGGDQALPTGDTFAGGGTLLSSSDAGGSGLVPAIKTTPAPDHDGREMTLQAMPSGDTAHTGLALPAELSGREMTLQTMPSGASPAMPGISGREMTLQSIPSGDTGRGDITGREMTLQTPVGGGTSGLSLTGREMTLQTPAAGGDSLTGRELTMQTPSAPSDGRPGTHATQVADTKPGTRATQVAELGAKPPTGATPIDLDSTPATKGGRPKSMTMVGRPATGTGTSVSFDDAWHLQGRKGPHTGQRWGDFELGGILGEGGMGAVYRAKQISLKRRVAIKVLPPNLASDTRLLQRFHLEATTSSKLSSPHVVQVYYIGEHEDNHYFAMEYVDGTDLYDAMKKRKDESQPYTPDESAGFILQAAKGLVEAARHGIVHRDIKPPNMMLTKDGLLKIADFGIVKVMGEHNLTMTGQAVGTPAYCSPEQGRGDADIDCRSDLYSLGVVFYELACGRKPFEATTPNALIYKHCYDEPDLPQKLNPAISDEYQAVILRSLAKKPENRYQTAADLVKDLEAIRAGSMLKSAIANYKLGTGAAEAKREQMNWFQRNLVKIAVAALIVVAFAAYGGYVLVQRANEFENRKKNQELEAKAAKAAADAKRQIAEQEEKSRKERAATLLKPSLEYLNRQAPVPDSTEARLDELAAITPDDQDLKPWRAKVIAVRALQKDLGVLDAAAIGADVRTRSRDQLRAYIDQVSAEDPSAKRWTAVLADLDDEERRLRQGLTFLDSAIGLTSERVEGGRPPLKRLTEIVAKDDRQVVTWTATVATFDAGLAKLRGELATLDEKKRLTQTEHTQLSQKLQQLKPLVAEGDPEVTRWGAVLASTGDRVNKLRAALAKVVADEPRTSRPTQERIKLDLAELTESVGAEDSDVVQANRAIKQGNDAIAAYTADLDKLKDIPDGDTIHRDLIAPNSDKLDNLRKLAEPGNTLVIDTTSRLARFQALLDQWQKELQRLDAANSQPVPVAQQGALAEILKKAEAKGIVDSALASQYRQRLADEQRRVERLRVGLAPLNEAVPISTQLRADLAQFLQDVPGDDRDAIAWKAKRDRVDNLKERLKPLDNQRIPDGVNDLFAALEKEVGASDADIGRWRDKVVRVDAARKALAPLDRVEPLPADAVANLVALLGLVGDGDDQYKKWKAKSDEVGALKAILKPLPTTYRQTPDEHRLAHASFRRLIALVGSTDREVVAWAPRQQELDGPGPPAWCARNAQGEAAYGRDEYGIHADLALAGETFRFRFVPSGRFLIGSPAGESGRESDEIQVPMIISRAFWVLEHEVTQGVWNQIGSANPSRFASGSASRRPVERVSWTEVRAWIDRLNQQVVGLEADLPSETQWEYVARAGAEGPLPKDGGTEVELSRVAWNEANSGGETHEIKLRFPNQLGIYDALGNVAEWCRDAYAGYPTTETVDHVGKGSTMNVARGGSWGDGDSRIRFANRTALRPEVRSAYLGFRLIAPVRFAKTPDGADVLADAGEESVPFAFTIGGAKIDIAIRLPRTVEAEPVVASPPSAPITPAPNPDAAMVAPVAPPPAQQTTPVEAEPRPANPPGVQWKNRKSKP